MQVCAKAITSRTFPLTLAQAHSHSTAVTHTNPKALTVSQSVSHSLTPGCLPLSQSTVHSQSLAG